DNVNIGKLDVALDLGHNVVALVVDDPQSGGALSPALGERYEHADLWVAAGEILRPNLVEDPDQGFLAGELVLDDLVANHDGQTARYRLVTHQRERSFWFKTR